MASNQDEFKPQHLYLEDSYLLIPPSEEKKRNEESENNGITIIEIWSDPEE